MRTLGTISKTKLNTSNFVSAFELEYKARFSGKPTETKKINPEIITESYSGPVSILKSSNNPNEVIMQLIGINKLVIIKNYNLIQSKIQSNIISFKYLAIKIFPIINEITFPGKETINIINFNCYRE